MTEMQQRKETRGRKAKSLEQHLREGTYSRTRHAHLADKPALVLPPKPKLTVQADRASQSRWIRSEADEYAFSVGCRFNEALGQHVVEFFRQFLRHSKGRWAGQPFEPTDWQVENVLHPLFGWVRPDGTRRFRRTYIELPKKQGKSSLASGIGLYGLLEEPGAEIYSFGGNDKQARIVHTEAINMVEASEPMSGNLKINRTTGVIAYHEQKSFYAARAASDNLAGINIHFAILDELHEWKGRSQWDSIIYGARARSQPLFLVITNAGDNKDSICYEQREKAERVAEGKTRDESFFPMVCAVTEKEAKAEIDAVAAGDFSLPVAKRVNPALGSIVSEQDFLRDIQDALEAPTSIPNLMRLSYGVWVTAGESRLLPPGRWPLLRGDFVLDDLLGRTCFAGIDLGFTHDFTALALWFPPDGTCEKHRVLCWYWLPMSVAENPRNRMRAEFLMWQQDERARLELTPGSVTDHGYLQSRFRELFWLFDVRSLIYDKRGAEKTTQELSEGLIGHDGKVLLDGTGIERVEFTQSPAAYSEPTKEFERLVIGGEFEHDGNPILAWQMEHCAAVRKGDFLKPIKPGDLLSNSHDYRTIDGVQATIMALAGSRADAAKVHGRCAISVLKEDWDTDED